MKDGHAKEIEQMDELADKKFEDMKLEL